MSDWLRDEIPYFKTWLTLTHEGRPDAWRRSGASQVDEIREVLERCERTLAEAKKQNAPDLAEIFSDIAIQLEDRLELAERKAERLK